MRSVRAYRALTRLYPPAFRREYGEVMVQQFTDRLRRDGARRAWACAARDLTTSAPHEHWETVMGASPQTRLVVAAVVTGAAAMFFLLVGGATLALALLLVVAWQMYAILRVRGHRIAGRQWWKIAGSGAALFVVLFLFFALPWPEDWRAAVPGEVAWTVAMLGFSASIVLVVTGALLGAARWAELHRGAGT
jgi:hypothetical protein